MESIIEASSEASNTTQEEFFTDMTTVEIPQEFKDHCK